MRDLENGWGEDVEDTRMGGARMRRMGRAKRCIGVIQRTYIVIISRIFFWFLGVVVDVIVIVVDKLIVAQETRRCLTSGDRIHNMQLSSLLLAAHGHKERWTSHLNAILFYFSGILSNKQCRGVLVAVNDDQRCVSVPADDAHRDLELPGRLFTESPY